MTDEPTDADMIDDQPDGARADESLLRLAAGACTFRSADGRYHARVAVSGRHEILGLRSAAFRHWLVDGYVSEHRKLPSRWAVRRVLEALEARAQFDADTLPVYVRVGRDQDDIASSYYLDLGDPGGQAIKICASGWSVVENPSVHFRRPQGHLPLPMPIRNGSIDLLRSYVNLNESDFRLLIGWMAAALRPMGPYPILAIHGEQGSAKSTLARVIRQLIDPQTAPLLAEPGSTRDLLVTALSGWLLAFDNVSMLPNWLSDSLCRMATGGGFATRALFSNDERSVMYAQRPIILNGIDEFVRKGDLADRGVFLHLPPIAPGERREEDEFWGSFRQDHPKILGGLLDAVAGALRELPSVRLAELPRMADFARFGEAVGRGLGWPAETFLAAYRDNRKDATISALEDSVLAQELRNLVEIYEVLNCTASPAEMLELLTRRATKGVTASARWPKTPSMLGNELRRLAPQLREHGIFVIFSRNKVSRLITLTTKTPDLAGDHRDVALR